MESCRKLFFDNLSQSCHIAYTADQLDNLRLVSSVLFTFIRVTNCLLFLYESDYKVIIHSVFGLCGLSDLWHCDKYLCSQRPHYGTLCIQFCPGPPTVITHASWSFIEFISDLIWDSIPAAHISSIVCHLSKCKFCNPSSMVQCCPFWSGCGTFLLMPLATGPKAHCTNVAGEKLLFCLRPLLLSCVSSSWPIMRNMNVSY